MPQLPAGTVTFMFTDIEGSTRLLDKLGADDYGGALAEHRQILRAAFGRHGGIEVDTQGDAFFVAFAEARSAVAAVAEALRGLADTPVRVRVGLHTGRAQLAEHGYVGRDVHLGARIAAAGHGGQVLLSKSTRDLVEDPVLDLGEHRVKDFADPVWIYQLGAERFPPLRTISNTNLPRSASSFVGRREDVEAIKALLLDGARLLTLTGPGGTGKTRLAIEVAAELVPEFRNGVFWVDLAALRDHTLVLDSIAQTLGVKDGLAGHIAEREMLLLLDNLEQVAEAAPELAELVSRCPRLRVLETSRELLRVRGEVEFRVPPLPQLDAVTLFEERSGLPGDASVAELCRRLDNLPLAVELAAARTSVLSPTQILQRIGTRLDLLQGGRDADARQQTLRAAIEWSHDLLNRREQELFAALSVFSGGFTLEAAEAVGGADLDTLQSLADKSLVRLADERFSMLETIREYARERLEDSGDAGELRRRHAEHFLAVAEEAEPHVEEALGGGEEWLDRLDRELDNLRAALESLAASGETERVLRLAGALSDFWAGKGHVPEGLRRLEAALRDDVRPTAARAKALNGAAELAGIMGDPRTMKLRAEEALALHRGLGNPRGTAVALQQLGYAVGEEGDWARAQLLLQESIRSFRELGEEDFALWTARTLAWTYAESGDRDRARALYEDGLRRARAVGGKAVQAALLGSLAWLAVGEGRIQYARPLLTESLRIKHDLGNVTEIAIGLCGAARAITALGTVGTAVRLISCVDALRGEIGGGEAWVARMNDETLGTIRKQLDGAAFAEAWEQGRKLTVDEAVAIAVAAIDEGGEAGHV